MTFFDSLIPANPQDKSQAGSDGSSPLESSGTFFDNLKDAPARFPQFQKEAYQSQQEANALPQSFADPRLYTLDNATAGLPNIIDTAGEALVNTWNTAGEKAINFFQDAFDSHKTLLQKGLSAGEAGMGALGIVFSPVTTVMAGAEKVPGPIGSIATGINTLFSKVGEGASKFATEDILQNIPGISQQTKDQVKPLVGELSALASQIILGEVGLHGFKKAGELTDAINEKFKADVTPRVTPSPDGGVTPGVLAPHPAETAQPVVAPKTGSEFFDSLVPNPEVAQAPKIDMNIHPEATGGILGPKPGEVSAEIKPTEIVPPTEIKPTEVVPPSEIPPIEKTPSGIATSVEAKSIEKGLVEKFKDVAGFDTKTVADQAARVSDLVTSKFEDAVKMIKGEIPVEKGTSPQMLFNAMEDHAFKTNDVPLLQELANSPIASASSIHAQEMRFMQERDPSSAVAQMQDLRRAREAAVEKKSGVKIEKVKEQTVGEIKDEIKKKSVTKQTWSEFVSSIQC